MDGITALAERTTGPGGSTVAQSKYGTVQTDGRMYYYTDLKGRKRIRDPRIGAHFGSQRHKISSIQKIEDESLANGGQVYSMDGREWVRAFVAHDDGANSVSYTHLTLPTICSV